MLNNVVKFKADDYGSYKQANQAAQRYNLALMGAAYRTSMVFNPAEQVVIVSWFETALTKAKYANDIKAHEAITKRYVKDHKKVCKGSD